MLLVTKLRQMADTHDRGWQTGYYYPLQS